jgi:two-component sensor histidine kinase
VETNNRAKNVLAIVDSIVRLSRSDNSAQYASSVQQRVQALSVAHLQLAETGWREVSLRDVIVRQVDSYKTKNVVISGPEIRLPAETVQPLALLFHELASNAALHGALSRPDGLLTVSWERTDDQVGFRLSWNERVSLSKTRVKPGFGTIMADAIVEKQLLGKLDRRWDEQGLETIIEIPAFNSPASSITGASHE